MFRLKKKIIPNKSNTTVIESIWSLRNLMEKLEVNLAFSNIQEFLYIFNFFLTTLVLKVYSRGRLKNINVWTKYKLKG